MPLPPDQPKRPPPLPTVKPMAEQVLVKQSGQPAPLRRQPSSPFGPPPRAKPPTLPQDAPVPAAHRKLVDTDDRPMPPESLPAPPPRKDSPPGGIAIHGRGWKVTMPAAALVAVLTAVGSWFGSRAVAKHESADIGDVLTEMRALRKDVSDLKGDNADVRDELRKGRSDKTKILNYTEDTFTVLVAAMRRCCGVKVEYDGRRDPARDVEFHPAPLGGSAPTTQPKATLPERPSL
jgi:hypothetical protein